MSLEDKEIRLNLERLINQNNEAEAIQEGFVKGYEKFVREKLEEKIEKILKKANMNLLKSQAAYLSIQFQNKIMKEGGFDAYQVYKYLTEHFWNTFEIREKLIVWFRSYADQESLLNIKQEEQKLYETKIELEKQAQILNYQEVLWDSYELISTKYIIAELERELGNFQSYSMIHRKCAELQKKRADVVYHLNKLDISLKGYLNSAKESIIRSMNPKSALVQQFFGIDLDKKQVLKKGFSPFANLDIVLKTLYDSLEFAEFLPDISSLQNRWGDIGTDEVLIFFLSMYNIECRSFYKGENILLNIEALITEFSSLSIEAASFIIENLPEVIETHYKIHDTELILHSYQFTLGLLTRIGKHYDTVKENEIVDVQIAAANLLYIKLENLNESILVQISKDRNTFDLIFDHFINQKIGAEALLKKTFEVSSVQQYNSLCSILEKLMENYSQLKDSRSKQEKSLQERVKDLIYNAQLSNEGSSRLLYALRLFKNFTIFNGEVPILVTDVYNDFTFPLVSKESSDYEAFVNGMFYNFGNHNLAFTMIEARLDTKVPEFIKNIFPSLNKRFGLKGNAIAAQLFLIEDLEPVKIAYDTIIKNEATFEDGLPTIIRKPMILSNQEALLTICKAIPATYEKSISLDGVYEEQIINTKSRDDTATGIRSQFIREIEAIRYLFACMYVQYQSPLWHNNKKSDLGENINRKIIMELMYEDWISKQKSFLDETQIDTLNKFNYNSFFKNKAKKLKEHLKSGNFPMDVFIDSYDLLLDALRNKSNYIDKTIVKNGLSDKFINTINRIQQGLHTDWSFDKITVEKSDKWDTIFNNIGECTAIPGKYEKYGIDHFRHKNIAAIPAIIYNRNKKIACIGKAFISRCKDANDEKKELLYVDGVIVLQDIADFLDTPNVKDACWKPMYTAAIIKAAEVNGLEEIVFNASHKLAQRTVWQYIKYIAELLGYKKDKDFNYKEGSVDNGNLDRKINLKTNSGAGFMLFDSVAEKNYHYLNIVPDTEVNGDILMEGFWLNYWKQDETKDKASSIPEFAKINVVQHRELPQINPGYGHVIGFRVSVTELKQRFSQSGVYYLI